MSKRFPVWLSGHSHLLTFMTKDEYQKRRQGIREAKPKDEHPLRLYLMRPVKGKLPSSIYKTWADYEKAGAARDKVWEARDKVWEAYDKARAARDKVWADYKKAKADCDKVWADYKKAKADCDKVWADYYKARADFEKARADCKKAWADYDKAIQKHIKEILALHKKEIPDSTWDGKTIFSDGWKEHPKAFF